MQYKLLALDIDGTIVQPHENTPSPQVIETIKTASKKIHISLVSARAWSDQKLLVDLLGLGENYHVLENGTKVINPSGSIEYDHQLSLSEVKNIVQVSEGLFDEVGFCVQGSWVKQLTNEKEVATISFISHDREKAEKIPSILKHLKHSYVSSVGSHWSNPLWAVTLISHKQASKGAGLAYIQQKLSVTVDQTIAIGDGASDVSTMQYAGVKAAMGNAEIELQAVANFTAPSVTEDGVVDVIHTFVLHE